MITREEILARRALMAKAEELRQRVTIRRKQLWQLPKSTLRELTGEKFMHRPELIELILRKEFSHSK